MSTQDKLDEIIKKVDEYGTKFVRLQFVDIHGTPKNMSLSINKADKIEDFYNNGLLFDGSSIPGFVNIDDSDLLLKPDINTVSGLPSKPDDKKYIRFICDIYHDDGTPFEGDPRGILRKSLESAKKEGYEYKIGPEPEFILYDEDEEGHIQPLDEARFFDVEPLDKGIDIKKRIILGLEDLNFNIGSSHHEFGPGQHEIDFQFDNALKSADAVITFKQAIKALVSNMGYKVTFMPKPFMGKYGNGMHCNQSLYKNGENVFYDPNSEMELSDEAYYFIGGLLKHTPALAALACPTVNSYKRLIPGYEAPCYIDYGYKNRSTLLRIPTVKDHDTRLEYRLPDTSCNPYLTFAALLQAGLDGMKNKIDPGEPSDINVYKYTAEEAAEKGIRPLPSSLWEAYHSLEHDKIIQDVLGEHTYNQFYNIKRAEWDDYRIQVFNYEVSTFLDV